jgi:hypothetical protein
MSDKTEPAAIRAAYRRVFDGPDGETVLRHILRAGGVLARGFTGEPLALAYAEGRRTLALQIIHTATGSEEEADRFLRKILSEEPLPPIQPQGEEP